MGHAVRLAGVVVVSLTAVLLGQAPPAAATVTPEEAKLLKDHGLAAEAKSLLEYFRKQTFPAADPQQMDKLVRDLGDDDFSIRETAYTKLLSLGKAALLGVKQAEKDNDPEVRRRAVALRVALESKAEPAIQVTAARVLTKLQPQGTAEVLLGFLPFAADATVSDEVCKALETVTSAMKEADPAVVRALQEQHPLKRGAAGQALSRRPEHVAAVRKMLQDPEPIVRVRVGLALVRNKDSAAVSEALPALIECLQHLPPESLWPVEDVLIRLAEQGKVPPVSLGTNEEARKKTYQAWNEWYGQNHKTIQLARLDRSEQNLGYTLMVYQNIPRFIGGAVRRPAAGEVMEVDSSKKVKWKLTLEDAYPVDAQVLPDRPSEVVVAEYQRAKISIRETATNRVVWERQVGGNPIGVQALPNGKIFVVLQNRLLEIDRATNEQKELLSRANHDIFRAKRMPSGDFVFVTNTGTLIRMDAKGVVQKQFRVPQIPVLFGNIDVLPNGNVLIPDFQQQRVVEYDTNGTQVSQFNTPAPSSALRLPNGNTLVASQNSRRVVEFNRSGQEIWSYDVDGQVFNARRR